MDQFVFLGLGGILLVWALYMTTCRPGELIALMRADEERRKAQHGRMTKTAGGAIKAGLTIFRLFQK